uniref:Uncharacterized protein n=1 Tax=viral metagenome TaxID=1070528 RepID=A0A6M3JTH6_9ZZZZ
MKRKLIWQDIVLMIGGFIFAPSLVVSIIQKSSIPVLTSLPTAIVLTGFIACYLTLKLRLAAFATSLTALCWFILFFMEIL